MNDPVRAYLSSVYEARLELERISDRALSLYESATRVTGATDAQRAGGGADRDALLAAFADADTGSTEREIKYAQKIREVSDFIDRVDDSRGGVYRMILRYRYLDGISWKRIAAVMSKLGDRDEPYTERHILRLHGEALIAAREEWRREHDTVDS